MKNLLFIILAGVVCSCKNTQPQGTEVEQETKKLSKLETLYTLPKDSIYEFYDLSNDSIKEFPDLSEYSIKKLDLSHNQLDSLIIGRLPKKVEDLNLSYNSFEGIFAFKKYENLNNLDLAHNRITYFYGTIPIDTFVNKKKYSESPLKRLVLNNNYLKKITFGGNSMEYLDISNNPKLSNEVFFDPKFIDTIIHHNIANNKKLIFYFSKPFVID